MSTQSAKRSLLLAEVEDRQRFTEICRLVSQHGRVPMHRLMSRNRSARVACLRQIAMTLCRELSAAPFEEIGEFFERDHGTIMHACRTVSGLSDTEPAFATKVAQLRALCEQRFSTPEPSTRETVLAYHHG